MGGQGGVRTPLPALRPGIPRGQPAAPGRAPASRRPAPPAAGCSKRLGGSRCALWGESEEPGKGWYMLGQVLPTGGAGIGNAKCIAVTFWFHSKDSKRHVQVNKKTFSAAWGPFFHPPGLPLSSWIPRNIRCPAHPRPVRVPLLLSRGTGSSRRQGKAGKGKWQLL